MMLSNIMEKERTAFADAVANIVASVAPEKMICYGRRMDYHESWSKFLPAVDAHCLSYYDMLIVTKETDEQRESEILRRIDACAKAPIHITALVHSIAAVNKEIRGGNAFFVAMYHKGMVVYDSKNIPLTIPDAELDEQKLARKAEKDWNQSSGLAEKYLTVAGMCVARATSDLWGISVLMAYEAAAHSCRAIIKYYTGYWAETPDLRRLLLLMKNFASAGEAVFPRGTQEETELFDALINAHNDKRHRDDYKVEPWIMGMARSRARHFVEVVEKLHEEKRNATLMQGQSGDLHHK